jgi:uncharacterized surface protein with fasciclin (FAS1) repeats
VFAPTDAAFAVTLDALGLSKPALLASREAADALIRMHVVAAKVPMAALKAGAQVATLEGTRLTVQKTSAPSVGGVQVAGAKLLRGDIAAQNGVIHGAARRDTPGRACCVCALPLMRMCLFVRASAQSSKR